MSEKSNYKGWLTQQQQLAQEALEFVKSFKFNIRLMNIPDKPSYIRINLTKSQFIDFFLKKIKTRFAREIWVCKVQDADKNFLIYAEKEKVWLVIMSGDIQNNAQKRQSTYNPKIEYLVIPREFFSDAKRFFKQAQRRLEERKQKRMEDYL